MNVVRVVLIEPISRVSCDLRGADGAIRQCSAARTDDQVDGPTIFEPSGRTGPVPVGCGANSDVCDRVRFSWVPLRARAQRDTTPSATARGLADG